MEPLRLKRSASNPGPEAKIQDAIIRELRAQEWYVKVMHGNAFQFGVPDLFAAHLNKGQRFIEVKNPGAYSFTPAQSIEFPKLHAAGVGIWVLFGVQDIPKLYGPANWQEIYLRWSYGAK